MDTQVCYHDDSDLCYAVGCEYCLQYSNEENWTDCDEKYCPHGSECPGKYNKYLGITCPNFIVECLPNGQSIIDRCNAAAVAFVDNIQQNRVPADAYDELNELCAFGCYMKRFIINLIQENMRERSLYRHTILATASAETILYYITVLGFDNYSDPVRLFVANRIPILEILKQKNLFHSFSRYNLSDIISICSKTSMENAQRDYLIESCGIETIIQTCVARVLQDFHSLMLDKYQNRISLDNLPARIENLNCPSSERNMLLSFPPQQDKVKPLKRHVFDNPPTQLKRLYAEDYNVSKVTCEGISEVIDNIPSMNILRDFASNQAGILANACLNALSNDSHLHNLKHFTEKYNNLRCFAFATDKLCTVFNIEDKRDAILAGFIRD